MAFPPFAPSAAAADAAVPGTPFVGPFVGQVIEQTDATLGAIVRQDRSSFGMAVLVMDGRAQSERAYGVEDPWSKTPLSIDSSLVDLNSLEKLFVSVAIAQLIDRGVIHSIDDPVNSYLKDFKLPKAFGREVTIREVATHNAGFEQSQFGVQGFESDPGRLFAQEFPGYFENTGPFSAYNGYGPRLLGYMVSQLTGMSFARYVMEAILRPLGMDNTYLAAPAEPLTHRIVPFQPKSPDHALVGGPLSPLDAPLPGQAVSTARDMSKFMLALLGTEGKQTIITPPIRNLIFQIYQSNGARGSAHGLLIDVLRSGATTIFNHGGVGAGLRCLLSLDFARNAGLFYCYGDVRSRLDRDPALLAPDYEWIKSAMLKPFLACAPGQAAACPDYRVPASWNSAWDSYPGLYIAYARHHHGPSQLQSLIYPTTIRVEKAGGTLRFDGIDGYVEIAPRTFGSPQAIETFSFVNDPATGKLVLSGTGRPSAYEHPSLLDDPRVLPRVLAVLVLIAISGGLLVLLPHYGIDKRVRLAAAAYATVVACGAVAMFGFHAYGQPYFHGVSWPLNMLRFCAFLTIPSCAALALLALRIRRTPRAGIGRLGQLHFKLIGLSSILMVLLLFWVGLISFGRIT